MVGRRTRAESRLLWRTQQRLRQAAALLEQVPCCHVQCLRVCTCGLDKLRHDVQRLSCHSLLTTGDANGQDESEG